MKRLILIALLLFGSAAATNYRLVCYPSEQGMIKEEAPTTVFQTGNPFWVVSKSGQIKRVYANIKYAALSGTEYPTISGEEEQVEYTFTGTEVFDACSLYVPARAATSLTLRAYIGLKPTLSPTYNHWNTASATDSLWNTAGASDAADSVFNRCDDCRPDRRATLSKSANLSTDQYSDYWVKVDTAWLNPVTRDDDTMLTVWVLPSSADDSCAICNDGSGESCTNNESGRMYWAIRFHTTATGYPAGVRANNAGAYPRASNTAVQVRGKQ